jgi:2-hydroxymuconate-semialdehyde hydrolase
VTGAATGAVTVRGARIRYRESGDPGRPPVVLLHGIGRSLEDWAPQHDRLSGTHRVLSLELAGFGLSDRLPEVVTLAALAGGVAGCLDALAVTGPVHLMGNSLGGAVAMEFLAGSPHRVATLSLLNSAGFGSEVTMALRLLAVPLLGRAMLRRIDPAAARRVERSLFFDRSFVTPARVEHALAVAARRDHGPVFLETARALGTVRGIRAGWRAGLLARVAAERKPTLLVWGDKDLILPHTHLAAARAALPWAEWKLYPDTGHMPQIERADDFAALAQAFLAAHPVTACTPPRSS